MGYNRADNKMKKMLIIVTMVVTGAIFTSFDTNNSHFCKTGTDNDYVFYTTVKAWTEATESTILYIYYKEGNGVRKYYSSCGDSRSMTCLLYVKKNVLYQSNACDDFRRNYKYLAYYGDYYFNCDKGLPYMVE